MQIDACNPRIHRNYTAVPNLKIYCFGPLRIELNGVPLALRTTKTAALLAYLAIEGKQPQPRTHLAALLWDGYEQQTARSSLRVALTYLRKAMLPLQPLHILHKCVQWNSVQAAIWCDVQAFEEAVGNQAEQMSSMQIKEAMTLYKGDFLAGWENVDSMPFQKWVLKRRTHYQTLRHHLQQRAITPVAITKKPAVAPPNRHNLLRPLTPLVGRTETVNVLHEMLLHPQHPLLVLTGEGGIGKTRLALAAAWSLVNININKISSAIPSQHPPAPFPDGIWFVPLGELIPQSITTNHELVERVATAISVTLSLRFTETAPIAQQLLTWLHGKALLLILDGFEHLAAADAFLGTLLQTAYGVKVLVTSRRRLNLQAATIFPVEELATPDETTAATATLEQLQSYPSIQLFVERAQRIRMDFQLDLQNGATIAQICRSVGSMPLGIELAAAMMTIYPASKIAEQLMGNAFNLQMTWADLSPWHRNIEQMLATSWQLLTAEEATLLAQCTLISGSFTLAAATSISGATPDRVRTLVEKSLLRQHTLETDRFTMHELVRHYAYRQLQQQPQLEEQTRARHAIYYLTLLEEQESTLPNESAAQQLITAELENIRAAWAWSYKAKEIPLLEQAYQALTWYYRVTAFHTEAFTLFTQTATALAMSAKITNSDNKRQTSLHAKLLLSAAEFARKIGRIEDGKRLLQEVRTISQELDNPELCALAHLELALIAQMQGDYAGLATFAQQSIAFAEQTEKPLLKLICQKTLAVAFTHNQQYSKAYNIYFAIYQSLQAFQNRYLQANIATDLGSTFAEDQEYSLARNEFQRALDCHYTLQTPTRHYTNIKLGYLWLEVGAFEQAKQLFTQAEAFLQTDNHPVWQIATHRGLGLLQQQAGNHIAANQHMTAAFNLAQAQQNAHLEYQVLIDQGDLLLTMGSVPEAIERYERVLLLCDRIGDTARVGDAQAALAKLRLMQQDGVAAHRAIDSALTTLAEQGLQAAWYPFRAYWYCYEVLQALDDPRSGPLLKQAYNQLQEIAKHIQEQELRHSFLYNVPANRAIISAVDCGHNQESQESTFLRGSNRSFLHHV